jgi:hypothetical protein
MDKGVDWCER